MRDGVDAATIAAKRMLMEEQIVRYVPAFPQLFRYVGPQLSIKTKQVGAHDDRTCQVTRYGRIFSVMSGKIDTVFFATERILSSIEVVDTVTVESVLLSLRNNITVLDTYI